MNQGPRFQCRTCKKYCKAAEKAVKCEDCEKRFYASCVNLGPLELQKIESGNDSWYCSNCKTECSLCSGPIRLSSVTNVKCGCTVTVLLCQTQSMKQCKTQTVHGFAQKNLNSNKRDDDGVISLVINS